MSDFCKHGYIGGCKECIGQMPDGKAIEDALRAEVARLQADKLALDERCCEVQECFDALQETSSDQIAALKAKLARYEADLTGPQQVGVLNEISTVQIGTFTLRLIDAAIRKVRGEP